MSRATKEQILETQPCGCKRWFLRTIVDDTIEEEEVERFEHCEEYGRIVERQRDAEAELALAYRRHGEHSPEFRRANMRHIDIWDRLEKHSEY